MSINHDEGDQSDAVIVEPLESQAAAEGDTFSMTRSADANRMVFDIQLTKLRSIVTDAAQTFGSACGGVERALNNVSTFMSGVVLLSFLLYIDKK